MFNCFGSICLKVILELIECQLCRFVGVWNCSWCHCLWFRCSTIYSPDLKCILILLLLSVFSHHHNQETDSLVIFSFSVSNPLVYIDEQYGVDVKNQEYFADSTSTVVDPASRDEWALNWISKRRFQVLLHLCRVLQIYCYVAERCSLYLSWIFNICCN